MAPAQDEENKGNKLLKKMGWKEGTGLGTEGEGRVDPVQALLFAQGAGIGSTKGRDPTKYQGGDGYTNLVKDGVSASGRGVMCHRFMVQTRACRFRNTGIASEQRKLTCYLNLIPDDSM